MKRTEYVPTDLVKKLAGEGKTDREIYDQLRAQGFMPTQIERAMKEAVRSAVMGPKALAPPAPRGPPARPDTSGRPMAMKREIDVGKPPEKIIIPESLKPIDISEVPEVMEEIKPEPTAAQPKGEITLEELVEKVVAEQSRRGEERVRIIEARMARMEHMIQAVAKEMGEAESAERSDQKGMLAKLDSFSETLTTIQGHVNSLERAFRELATYKKKEK